LAGLHGKRLLSSLQRFQEQDWHRGARE